MGLGFGFGRVVGLLGAFGPNLGGEGSWFLCQVGISESHGYPGDPTKSMRIRRRLRGLSGEWCHDFS